LSSSTESYMQIEEKIKLTRRLLKIILKYKFPVGVATKSKLVLRDLDILKEIDKNSILPDDLKSKLKRPVDCKILYFKFLEKYYPELVPKYKSLYKIFFAPSKEYQKEFKEKSKGLCEKYGIKNRIKDIVLVSFNFYFRLVYSFRI